MVQREPFRAIIDATKSYEWKDQFLTPGCSDIAYWHEAETLFGHLLQLDGPKNG